MTPPGVRRTSHAKVPARGPSVSDLPAAPPPDEGLVRALGLGSAILFVLGSVIGSGLFLTTGVMAAALPSPGLIYPPRGRGGHSTRAGGTMDAQSGSTY